MSFHDESSEHLPVGTVLRDAEGQQAQVTGSDDANGIGYLLLQDPQGRQLRVPQHMLMGPKENYRLPFAFSSINDSTGSKTEAHVLPVIQIGRASCRERVL